MLLFSLTVFLFGVAFGRDCSSQPSPGFTCNEHSPSIQYYFDEEHMSCYPFGHNGCDLKTGPLRLLGPDSKNGYPTVDSCWHSCMPMDYNSCGYSIRSTGTCSYDPSRKAECSPDAECHMGAFFGICCPKDKIQRSENPKCEAGKRLVKQNDGQKLISKRCSLNFCPKGSQCIDGEFFAYCCQ
ncbi:unnamed protein product, partial [Mesorhabditis belari]|uniref:BPTI/Kunitz inhibitor domain-containing protein n=1 Tax=Mesorhabditis belari TaxID=2138241 RepID=A0AAF3FDF2_9BILA